MRIFPFFSLLLAIGVACTTPPTPTEPPEIIGVCPAGPSDAALDVLSFNGGLGHGINDYAIPRAGPVAQAIAAADWDVLCLDEVYTEEDQDAILSKLALPEDQVVRLDTRGENEDSRDRCAPGELDEGLACMRRACSGLPDEDVTLCAQRNCGEEGLALYLSHPHCFTCVVAAAGMDVEEIQNLCEGPGATKMFGGRNGVTLASRVPLKNVESIELPSSHSNRAAHFATIDVEGESVEVACTHLSHYTAIINPDRPGFKTWDAEMEAQLRIISDHLSSRAQGRKQLLLGDLNTGPSFIGDMISQSPNVWKFIGDLGFVSPAASTDPQICSRCLDRLLEASPESRLIDHVLTRGDDALKPECAAQALDERIDIVDLTGTARTTNYSDHYGIRVRFSH